MPPMKLLSQRTYYDKELEHCATVKLALRDYLQDLIIYLQCRDFTEITDYFIYSIKKNIY
jgi:hypothetical protein